MIAVSKMKNGSSTEKERLAEKIIVIRVVGRNGRGCLRFLYLSRRSFPFNGTESQVWACIILQGMKKGIHRSRWIGVTVVAGLMRESTVFLEQIRTKRARGCRNRCTLTIEPCGGCLRSFFIVRFCCPPKMVMDSLWVETVFWRDDISEYRL